MAYIVGEDFTEQLYSGESIFRATLVINDVTIPNDQIASISISSPIVDSSKDVFYLGSFISQKITIKFKNMDNIAVESGQEVSLSIGQYVLDELDPESSEWVDVPIGKFLIDDLAEDYYEKCEISCLDYGVKFKPNVDYSECFTNGKATIGTILQYVCEHCNVLLGDYPKINDDVEIGTYDSTVSGKQWISYIAEIKGCNAKIDRQGKLTLQPLKQPSKVSINALESASFETGEKFKISQVTYFDAIRNFTFGNDTDNTLFIRQDNPFINDENVVKNIYESIVNEKQNITGSDLDLDNTDEYNIVLKQIYGNTSQDTLSGKNLWGIADQTFRHCGIDVTIKDGVITLNGTTNGVGVKQLDAILPTTTATGLYTLSKNEISGTKDESGGTGNFNVRNNDTGSFIFSCALSETNKSYNITSATPIKFGLYLQSGCTYTNYKFKPQLELGGNVTSYEQYCGGIPSPNPNYPQNVNTVTGRNVVKVQGKNLYNINDKTATWNDLTTSEDDWITINSTNTGSSQMYRAFYTNASKILKPNTDYWCILEILGDKTYTGSPSIEFVSNYVDNKKAQFDTEFRMDISDSRITDGAILKQKITTRSDLNDCITMTRSIATIPANSSLNLTFRMSIVEEEPDVNTFAYEPYQEQEKEIDLGKNLFDKDNANYVNGWIDTTTMRLNTTNGNRMFYISCKPNTTYTISRSIITSSFRTTTYDSTPFPTVTSSNVDYTVPTVIKNNSGTTLTITTGANAKYLVVHYGKIEDTNLNETLATIQLEEGSVATEYTPYYNVSKNLFDGVVVSGRWNINVGQVITSNNSTGYRSANPIEIKPNTVYTASVTFINSGGYIVETDENNVILAISGSDAYIPIDVTVGTKKTKTITSHANAKYLYWYNAGANANKPTDFMLEEGNVYTEYEPYDKHIELCKIGTYQDYITKNTGKNLFDISKWYNYNSDHNWTGNGIYYISSNGEIISNTASHNDYFSFMLHMSTSPTDAQKEQVRQLALKVEPNTKYTISFDNPNGCYMQYFIFIYDNECKYINHWASTMSTSKKRAYTYTTSSDQSYLFIRFDNESYINTAMRLVISNLQIEEGETVTAYEPYGKGEWYEYHNVVKQLIFPSNVGEIAGIDSTKGYIRLYIDNKKNYNNEVNVHQFVYCSNLDIVSMPNANDNSNKVGIMNTGTEREFRIRLNKGELNIQNTKDYFINNNVYLYFVASIPQVRKITYQPLIDQLNDVDNLKTYEGKTYITSSGSEANAPIDIDYYTNSDFELYSVKTKNYGDFTLDAWDNIEYDLDGVKYNTLNNNNITYEMTVMSDVDTKIPTKQQTVTTNIIGGDDSVNIKKIKTEVDNLNATATILAQQTTNNSSEISQLQVNVSSIQNLFTLTGGINLIRNSAFLLTDAVWTFTDNGLNPYHTELGNSFDISTTGKTVSISEIKLQDVIAKTTNDNITGLKTDGTAYTLNFYYKQDENTTTTIKMYDKNNTSAKAFDDIVLTGQSDFTNYSVSFVPNSSDYLIEISTATIVASGSFYLYDLMLNSGDIQPWQPASDEIYSTTLSMSRQGLKVYSVGDGTITLLGSDGLLSYETTDGKTLGKLVSQRTVDGDKVRSVDTQSIELGQDITSDSADRWLETTVVIDGNLHKVLYLESGD